MAGVAIPLLAAFPIRSATQAKKKKGKKAASTSTAPARLKWGVGEEVKLAKAWLNNSLDPISGKNQKNDQYWKKVHAEFQEQRSATVPFREWRACKDHWHQVNKKVTKFQEKYVQHERTLSSGGNEMDVLAKARDSYKSEEGHEFNLMHVWEILRGQPKWKPQYISEIDIDLTELDAESEASKRARLDESFNYTSGNGTEHEHELNSLGREERPIGQKRAKAKARGKRSMDPPPPATPIPPEELDYLKERMQSVERMEQGKIDARKDLMLMLRGIVAKDTSNMSDVEKNAHFSLIDSLGKSLASL